MIAARVVQGVGAALMFLVAIVESLWLDLLSASASTAASNTEALDIVIRAGGVFAVVGAVGLLAFGRRRSPTPAAETAA